MYHNLISAVRLALLVGFLLVGTRPALAQDIDLGGRLYMDYYYMLSSPESRAAASTLSTFDEARPEGLHGFTFRRLYLTTDFRLSEAFSGRVRLEADEGTVEEDGSMPNIKDLYLTWQSEAGHALTFGITPPPVFGISEDVWGYRSLDQTIMDLNDIASSRDFGVRATGPLAGDGLLRYAVMYANNRGVKPESNKSKRVYARLQASPGESLVFTLGGDYAGYEGEGGAPGPADAFTAHAFAGYATPGLRAGLKGYWQRFSYDLATPDHFGVSLFAALQMADDWEAVGRVDRARHETLFEAFYRTYALAGVAYRPHEMVRFMPNLRLLKRDDQTANLQARVTLHVDF